MTAVFPEFYGRAAALHELVGHAAAVRDTGHGRLLVVGGRRQVGKSRLVTEFVERSRWPALYLSAPATPASTAHMRAWADAAARATTRLPEAATLFDGPPRGWADALTKVAAACEITPSIVVLDDLAVVRAAEPRIDEILASHWQRSLRRRPILFVVIGDAGALPADATMTLEPFNPGECAHALGPDATAFDAFDAYLITGGIPRLVAGCARMASAVAQAGPGRRVTDARDPANAVDFARSQLLDENSDLVAMAGRIIATELAESVSAQAVLTAIGGEDVELTTFSRIVASLPTEGIAAQTAATRALKLLTQTKGLAAAQVPLGAPANTRLRRYYLTDHYLRFWCSFIRPRMADIARGRPDLAVGDFDTRWPVWREAAIGPIVRDSLRRLALTMPALTRVKDVGGWWNRDGSRECGLVLGGDSAHKVVALGMVKWRPDDPVTLRESRRLAPLRDVVPSASRARLVAVCPAGIEPDADIDVSIDAEKLLSAW